jgi:two-component system, NtrC family, response regulator AtoC
MTVLQDDPGRESILVVEDDEGFRKTLALSLDQAGYQVVQSGNAKQALEALKTGKFSIILCDFNLPDCTGLEFIAKAKDLAPEGALVLMTAFGNVDLAVQAMRAGAYDYISKPFSFEELLITLKKIEERERLLEENAELKSELTQKYSFANMVASSKAMIDIFETVKRLANFNTTVLVTGESGTGKELLARAIHHNSPRRGKPFIAINCGAIPENLMESELFGHKKGSFTDATRDKRGLLEEADGGTVFLDEIGEMPPHLQVKLLRALQEQQIRRVGDELSIQVDIRVVAATLRNLEEDVKAGRFRDDLFYRLNVVTIHIPPLRERPEDIPVLVQHFLKKHNKRLGLKVSQVAPEAMKCLVRAPWRGNIRELENCVERSLVLTETNMIDLESLPEKLRLSDQTERAEDKLEAVAADSLSIKAHARALEMKLIRKALEKTSGNRTHAARALEISHRALLYKLKEYGLGEK